MMKNFAWCGFVCLLASTEGFVAPGVATARHVRRNSAESREDATTSARRTTAAGIASVWPSTSRLFAKATYKNFEDMLEKEPGVLLVDFYATWCGPCKMMAENLAVVGPEMKDELKIFKIDSDKYPKLMSKFEVNGLPTLILFKEGKELQRIEGFLPADQLIQQLRYFLAGAAGAGVGTASAGGDKGGDACAPPPPQDACAPPPQDACAPPPRDACAPPPQE